MGKTDGLEGVENDAAPAAVENLKHSERKWSRQIFLFYRVRKSLANL